MRKVLIPIIILIMLALVPPSSIDSASIAITECVPQPSLEMSPQLASAGGNGDDGGAIQILSRSVFDQQFTILNTFTSTEKHNETLDFTSYQIPGWTLYTVTMDIANLTAEAEKETLGSNDGNLFRIEEHGGSAEWNQLAQGFYNQPHNGTLHNFSVYYYTLTFGNLLSDYGNLYLEIRNDYTDNSKNITVPKDMPAQVSYTWFSDVSSVVLNASTQYYAIIDGSDFSRYSGSYPEIWWRSNEPSVVDWLNARYDTFDPGWDNEIYEAWFNYTYTPWNKTTNSPLLFSSPTEILLRGNSTQLTNSNQWTFSSGTNITSIDFDSNQSVIVNYNLTLWYRKTVSTTSTWNIPTSGGNVEWNKIATLIYPVVAEPVTRYLNISKMSDWTVSGLYNGSSSTDYGNYVTYSTLVVCSQLTNGVWTLSSSAHNYITNIGTYDQAAPTTLTSEIVIDNILNINSTLQDASSNPVISSSTNLSIWHSGTREWAPGNVSVSTGAADYQWDVDTNVITPNNGTFTIEVYWSNGTEAGYQSRDVIVYYTTSLTPAQSNINAYADNSFPISVYFEDTFNTLPIDGSSAGVSVVYSFDGGSNQSLTDHSNGTWTATISTAGYTDGAYQVQVYSEGLAIQNQSITIDVTLTYETQALVVSWSSPHLDSITYLESTNLTVQYNFVNGTLISGASLSVWDGTNNWNLHENSTHYWIQFNGSDSLPGFGTFNLNITASKAAHQFRFDDTETLQISEEPTSIVVSWSSTNSITFLKSTNLTVYYRLQDTSPVLSAWVNFTIGPSTWNFTYDPVYEYYWFEFNGNFTGIGSHTINIEAWYPGHQSQTPVDSIDVSQESTTHVLWWSSPHYDTITYLNFTTLYLSYQLIDTTNITDAWVNVTVDGTWIWNLKWDIPTQSYRIQFNGTDNPPDIGVHSLNVSAWKYGYVGQLNEAEGLTIDLEPTTYSRSWSTGLSGNFTYVETAILTVNYRLSNGSPVLGATVYARIPGLPTTWYLTYSVGAYRIQFNGTDAIPGFGLYNFTVYTEKVGHLQYTVFQYRDFHVRVEPTSGLVVNWNPANATIPYIDSLNLQIDYIDGGGDVPSDAWVNVTLNGIDFYNLTYTGTIWNITIRGEDITYGIYTAIIEAWRYGYEAQTNTTANINITLAANSFIVLWNNPSDLNATYFEQVNITIIYTYENAPVLGATVKLILNDTRVYDMTFSFADDRWHLLLDASTIGLGTWNATVLANQTGYDTGTEMKNLTISIDPCTATPNWVSTSLYYTHQENLDVTILDSLGQPVADAYVNATYRGSSYALAHIGGASSGLYRLLLDGFDGLGSFSIQVWTWRYGLVNRTFAVDLDIVDTETSGVLTTTIGGYDNTTLYHDGWIYFSVYVEDIVDSFALGTLTVNITLDTEVYPMVNHANGTYTLNLTGVELGIAVFSGTLSADTYGYATYTTPINFEVEAIPTRLVFITNPIPSEMYYNQTVRRTISFYNNHTGLRIEADTTVFNWAGSGLTVIHPETGVYTFDLSAEGLSLTSHALLIELSLANHSTQQISMSIPIRAVHTSLTTETDFSEYEQWTITLNSAYTDLDRGLPISWGTVQVTINGVDYEMVYNSTAEQYELLFETDLTPDSYSISFSAEGVGCDDDTTTSTLIVTAKQSAVLTVDFLGNVVQGAPIVIRAELLSEDSSPIDNQEIFFHISVIYDDGHNVTETLSEYTESNGIAELTYTLPEDQGLPDMIYVRASFEENRQTWSTSSDTISAPIGMDFWTALGRLFFTIEGLFLLFIVTGIVGGSTYTVRSHRRKRRTHFSSLETQLQNFKMLYELQHFMAIYGDRGTCVIYHPFGEARIQPDLVSGFIAAITSVYGEITGEGIQGTLEEINYQGLMLNSFSGKFLIGILISDEHITDEMREGLRDFVEDFEIQYEKDLDGWVGLVDNFEAEWTLGRLYESLHYGMCLPHTLSPKPKGKYKKVIKFLQPRLDEKGEFRIADILDDLSILLRESDSETLEYVLEMIEKGAIIQCPIPTFLHREGCTLFGGTDFNDTIDFDVIEEADIVTYHPPEEGEGEVTEDAPEEPIGETEVSEEPSVDEEESTEDDIEEPEEKVDPREDFVSDVEELLRKEKDKKDEGNSGNA